jgi:hypothetical protein
MFGHLLVYRFTSLPAAGRGSRVSAFASSKVQVFQNELLNFPNREPANFSNLYLACKRLKNEFRAR